MAAVLTQIVVDATPDATVQQGQSQHLSATGTFSDGRTENHLPQVKWETQNPEVASIDSDGVVASLVPGTTEIHAHRDQVQSIPIILTVEPLPPIVNVPLRGGDTEVGGKSAPLANVQVAINGEPQKDLVQANEQGVWRVKTSSPSN